MPCLPALSHVYLPGKHAAPRRHVHGGKLSWHPNHSLQHTVQQIQLTLSQSAVSSSKCLLFSCKVAYRQSATTAISRGSVPIRRRKFGVVAIAEDERRALLSCLRDAMQYFTKQKRKQRAARSSVLFSTLGKSGN
jgi:hypothetical protein